MSFVFCNIKVDDVRENYEQIGRDFYEHYYKIFDKNFPDLRDLYIENPCITFRNEKFDSFDKLNRKVFNDRIWSFTHHEISGDIQPVGSDGILINATGILSANTSLMKHKFNDTILLRKNHNNNRFYIHNSIFKVVD